MNPIPHSPELTEHKIEKPSLLVNWWRKVGGGSLAVSIIVHIALFIIAGLIVFTTVKEEKPEIIFTAGGGMKAGEKSPSLTNQQVKRTTTLTRSTAAKSIVSTNQNSSYTLPTIDSPAPDSLGGLPASGNGGQGGLGNSAAGKSIGDDFHVGGAKVFVGKNVFGSEEGKGMPGMFYDLKQNDRRKPTEYAGNMSEREFADVIFDAARKRFSNSSFSDFYHADKKMNFNYLLVPNSPAEDGPKAFGVENEVKPRAWLVHYSAEIRPPAAGDYRFVGLFDDALLVYINHKLVLDGSWYDLSHRDGDDDKARKNDIRTEFGGPPISGENRTCYAGKWVHLDGNTQIDIIIGERPGGRVGGLLMVQNKNTNYQTRADGSPILPLFSTTRMTQADLSRISEYEKSGFELARDTPVFHINEDALK